MGYIGKVKDTAGNTHLVGSTLYGTCTTVTGTAAKVVTCPDYVEEVEGVTIHVHFTNKNTAGCTLNVNSKGAHTCVGASDIPGTWEDDSVASFTLVKDGNTFYWYQNNLYWEGGTDTKVTQTATTTSSDYPILFKNSANQSAETAQVRYGNTSNKVPKINPSTGNISTTTFNGYTLDAACEKGVDTSIASGSTSTNVPTTEAVRTYVDSVAGAAAAGALVYQGTLGATTGTTAALPASHNQGWYYVVADAGTYAGKVCEPGDMIICNHTRTTANNSDWDVVQNNIETLTTTEVSNLWTAAVAVS